jgi:hypothetical protein
VKVSDDGSFTSSARTADDNSSVAPAAAIAVRATIERSIMSLPRIYTSASRITLSCEDHVIAGEGWQRLRDESMSLACFSMRN